MRVASLFTGVGGFDLGLERAGHEVVFMCENDEAKQQVLRRHWPDVRLASDVRAVHAAPRRDDHPDRRRDDHANPDRTSRSGSPSDDRDRNDQNLIPAVDLVCGGFPCQDLSVAGRRAGLAGERSGLFHEAARIAGESLPDGGWLLIENVPGLFSSNDGRDFAVVVRTLGDLGFHDLAWRVLDSRHFGVPQRRRRVFILARRADGDLARKVLLEPEGSRRNHPPSGQARQADTRAFGQSIAGTLGGRRANRSHTELDGHGAYVAGRVANCIVRDIYHHGGPTLQDVAAGHLIVPESGAEQMVSAAVTAKWKTGSGGPAGDEHHNLAPVAFRSKGGGLADDGVDASTESVPTLTTANPAAVSQQVAAFDTYNYTASAESVATLLTGRNDLAMRDAVVRRLTPTECERLQGFPDGWTIPTGPSLRTAPIWYELDQPDPSPHDPRPDGPRYAAMGDAVTVPVAEWIGRRLIKVTE